MDEKLLYAVTDMRNNCFFHANTDDGLASLGLRRGQVKSSVVCVDYSGRVSILTVNKHHRGFSGWSSSLYDKIDEPEVVAEVVRLHYLDDIDREFNLPRAIVHRRREDEFFAMARILKLVPTKMGEF